MMRFAILALLFICSVSTTRAADISVVGSGGTGKESISLADLRASGDAGQIFAHTLKADLERSGWFTVGTGRYETLRVSGTAQASADALRTQIEVSWPKGRFAWGESTRTRSEARWQAHRLSDEIVRRVLGKTGMAASRIAMIGKHDGSDVYLCDSDGANMVRLTQDRVNSLSPYWHPDGSHIFYTTFIRGYPCIYRVPATGGSRVPLAQFAGLNTGGAVSPDGTWLALILSLPGNPELYLLNLHTKRLTRLTNTPRAAEASPCWSPDGQSIAYVSDASGSRRSIPSARQQAAAAPDDPRTRECSTKLKPDGRIVCCTRQNGYQIALVDPPRGSRSHHLGQITRSLLGTRRPPHRLQPQYRTRTFRHRCA